MVCTLSALGKRSLQACTFLPRDLKVKQRLKSQSEEAPLGTALGSGLL